ncbi:hypothetical protein BDV25DRAFT_166024 [Aspergillus avenaceus]|uniref:PPP4R2-domain-containing protein n=1 Tax=Aspergillus avenaceus TaxID=36643 RepID=A0A5N6TEL4_ASPAV|nr:hypothetical protein BDV25DRAFT_166024 [Aspergillus avenaceus]
MSLDEETLQIVANGGVMDFEKWPGMVESVIERLDHIVYNIFPMPQMPPEINDPTAGQQPPENRTSSFLQEPSSVPSTSHIQDNSTLANPQSQPPTSPVLPSPLLLLLNSNKSTLRSLFALKPPHTIQRLAELLLRPNRYYRTLPAYLRAIDRVISVTSSADVFPLQSQASSNQPNGVMNGSESGPMFLDHALGSDESLGGALLTPIPWLTNANSPDAGGDTEAPVTEDHGSIPEASQEQHSLQQETNDAAQDGNSHSIASTTDNQAMEDAEPQPVESEDIPHARGPRILGVEDLGLQDGKGVEMTLESDEKPANNDTTEQGGQLAESSRPHDSSQNTVKASTDDDGDITLDDARNVGVEAAGPAVTDDGQDQQKS